MIKLQQTYLIGLGGQGREALEHFRRRAQAAHGALPAVKLLAIDVPALSGEAPRESVLETNELVELPLDAAGDDPASARRLCAWLPEQSAEGGAWLRSRAAARLAWHLNLPALLPFLVAHLNDMGSVTARDAMAAKGFDVSTERTEANLVVVGDLGDRAAGGLLLDAAYLFHHLYRAAGMQAASTALLLLPPVTGADPAAEARAYAALKEINAFMGGGRPYRCDYAAGGDVFLSVESDAAVFNRGCYLIDTRNEKTYTLADGSEAARLAGEWLFRSLLTPLKGRVDSFAAAHGALPWVQGQLAAYNSLGLASLIVPIDALIDWSACRLGDQLIADQVLKPELFARVSDRLANLTAAARLKPDDLIGGELRRDQDGKPIRLQNELIARLKTLPIDQIVPSVQAATQAIGRDLLPGFKKQIEANARRVSQDVDEAIDQEVAGLLRARPAGGLSQATQLVSRLRDDAIRYRESIARRETALLARNQQQVTLLAAQGPLLRAAAAGLPGRLLIAAAAAGGLLAPLALTAAWLWQGLADAPPAARLALVAATGLASLLGAAYAAWRSARGVERVRDRYVTYLQNRFETELSLALARAARALYDDVTAAAESRLARLEQLSGRLRQVSLAFRRRVELTPLTGSIDFSLQRSTLTEALVESVYRRYAGDAGAEPHLYALVEKHGALDAWIDDEPGRLEARLLDYGRALFQPMRDLRVEPLIREQESSPAPQADLERIMRELHDKAAPLCTFNLYQSGQAPVSTTQAFVGVDAVEPGDIRAALDRIDPAAIYEPSADPHSLFITTVRRGMPLFSLLRMADFRHSYLDAVRRRAEPLHVDDDLAMTPDLAAATTSQPGYTQPDPGAVFALAMAYGLIARRSAEGAAEAGAAEAGAAEAGAADGDYCALDEEGSVLRRLAPGRFESAILLSADDQLLAKVDSLAQACVAAHSAAETTAELAAYLRVNPVPAWERRRIQHYLRMLRR